MVEVVTTLKQTVNGNFFDPDDPGEILPNGTLSVTKRLSVTATECEILLELANGHRVVEIGTGLGVGTVALAAGAHFVLTVDPDPWVQREIWPGLHDAGIVTVNDLDHLPGANRFTFAFVDGNHTYDLVRKDLIAVKNLILPMCPVFIHDYNIHDVRNAALDTGFQCVKEFGGPCAMVVGVLP